MSKNLVSYNFSVTKTDRQQMNNHNSFVIWFTGLSGAGKSTVANALEVKLQARGIRTYLLDGDNVRKGINKDLTMSPTDRKENVRRVAEISNLFIDAGMVVLSAFVSPYREDRLIMKEIVGENNLFLVYVNTSLEVCEKRDVKGLYKKARNGEITNLTGVNAPYERPISPDIEICTDELTIEESVDKIILEVNKKLNYE